jgi:type II secretory pathway pseudopilin PulG
MNRRRTAFTMIELLVVIGIIVVLIGLLVPVISKVRLTAKTADVTNHMHRISAAIGNYFNDFQAYPGALANKEFTPSGNLSLKLGNTSASFTNFATYTQSEDLVMALRGGFQVDTSGKLDLKPTELGLGPISFNAVGVSPRKHAYVESIPSEFAPERPTGAPVLKQLKGWPDEYPGLSYVIDSEAPEFLDSYSDPRPIVYLRANASAAGGNIMYSSKKDGMFRPNFDYDISVIQGYLKASSDFPIPKTSPQQYAYTATGFDTTTTATRTYLNTYFGNSAGSAAKNAGSYMLIDAGPDRIFGTDDDIIVGAGGGQ